MGTAWTRRCGVVTGCGLLAALAACAGGDPAPGPVVAADATVADAKAGGGGDVARETGAPPAPDVAAVADAPPAPEPDASRSGDDTAVPDTALSPDVADPGAACGVCSAYAPPVLLGRVQAPGLGALSGIAASWRNPGVLYVHNDRDRPEFFALDEKAQLLGHFTLTGGAAAAKDIEDVEVARCPAGTCVYLADLGNNVTPRTDFVILRVPEPDVAPGRPVASVTVTTFDRFVFSYADGPHNAESLIIDPATGNAYVITKVASGPSAVYRLAMLDPARPSTAVKVADLTVPKPADGPATAASAHPCGRGFVLRTNSVLYEFRIPTGAPFEQAFAAMPMLVPAGTEPQSEAVAYRPDGRGHYTTSEGNNPPVHRVLCQ